MRLQDFRPKSQLVTRQTRVTRPRFPVVDAHNHLAEPFGGGWDRRPVDELLAQLDEAGVVHYVDLDGGWGEAILQDHLDRIKARAPERFSMFGGVNWDRWPELGNRFPAWAAERLRVQKAWGADGLKIWKPFGLHVRDHHGQRVRVNDPRLDVLWATAAELHMPVLIHVADPVAFFEPIDETNERWEELQAHPEWAFPSPPFPSFHSLMRDFCDLVRRHPQTTFIAAHMAYPENLHWVAHAFNTCPNLYADFSARVAELGRQPYTARRFFLHYAERILFGLDLGPSVESYRISYRFLETDDEYFPYSLSEIPPQGRWQIYGLYLPDAVLRKVYYDNARRILLAHRPDARAYLARALTAWQPQREVVRDPAQTELSP
ncbi:MAG: amidohydrolase family protein [Chloroflexi bacterium]|nr:amidohydrolase family protein [Chloroflexota bacterium]